MYFGTFGTFCLVGKFSLSLSLWRMKRTRSAQKRNKIKRLWIRTSPYQKRVARCGRVNDSECASGVRNVFSAPTPPRDGRIGFTVPSQSSGVTRNPLTSDSAIATCPEHHEGEPGGCAPLRLACRACPLRVSRARVRIHLRIPGRAREHNHPGIKPRDLPRRRGIPKKPDHNWRAEGARRLFAARVRLLVPVQLGQRQHAHTHTVSICNSIAPHGCARPRAVTQMALDDLQMTYLPDSASSPWGGRGPCPNPDMLHANIHPTSK